MRLAKLFNIAFSVLRTNFSDSVSVEAHGSRVFRNGKALFHKQEVDTRVLCCCPRGPPVTESQSVGSGHFVCERYLRTSNFLRIFAPF